jgi:anti-sigma factor RsiW
VTKKKQRQRLKLSQSEEALCRRAVSVIADYLSGDLSEKDHQHFEAHLAGCEDCTAFFNTYRQSVQAVKTLKYEALPPEVQARILNFVRQKSSHDG